MSTKPPEMLRQSEQPFEVATYAAVAIKHVGENQLHLGILHRLELNEGRLLHFAWHKTLKDDPANSTYFWISPGFHTSRARQIASLCRTIADFRPELPYGFGSPADVHINIEEGSVIFGGHGVGLTCASFVLAVFAAAGWPLVDVASWVGPSDEDVEWQKVVIEKLRQGGVSEGHLELVSQEIGNVRFRPEQVAAASSFADPNVPCSQLEPLSAAIRQSAIEG